MVEFISPRGIYIPHVVQSRLLGRLLGIKVLTRRRSPTLIFKDSPAHFFGYPLIDDLLMTFDVGLPEGKSALNPLSGRLHDELTFLRVWHQLGVVSVPDQGTCLWVHQVREMLRVTYHKISA